MKWSTVSFALAALMILSGVTSLSASAAEPPSDRAVLEPVWKDVFRLGSADGKLVFSPLGIAQPMFVAHFDPDSTPAYEGSGFVLRRMAIGFDARLYGRVRAFLAANLASGNTALWDYFVDVTSPWCQTGSCCAPAAFGRGWRGIAWWRRTCTSCPSSPWP